MKEGWMTGDIDGFEANLPRLFEFAHDPIPSGAWALWLRRKYNHFTPDEYYEAAVDALVDGDTDWLDVGGGSAIFPGNPRLARQLADRCKRLVAVDPSENVDNNSYAQERHRCFLEDHNEKSSFSLATARMVVEHVARPEQFVAKLSQLVRPGGRAVIYTVNKWAPMTILSGCTPIALHHAIKRLLWETEEKDTFPVEYLMNTRVCLGQLFTAAGFREVRFQRLDDCRTLGKWKSTMSMELMLWKALRGLGLGYPESCLLGIYERV
jgi:2-polyprenyl-3-methyl-5-hydroxy-6-metoxy-1,4-benzoquinol methylase